MAKGKGPHGMVIKVRDGEGGIEKIMFASVAKCGELAEKITAVRKIEHKLQKQEAKFAVLNAKVEKAATEGDIDDVEAVTDKLLKNADKQEALTDERDDAIVDFYLAGLTGAGYTAEEAQDWLGLLEIEKFLEIRRISRTGCGYVDFTKAEK